MPDTRSNEAIINIIDKRFDDFKTTLIADIMKEIKIHTAKEMELFDKYVEERKAELLKPADAEWIESVKVIKEHVKKLQSDNVHLRSENEKLIVRIDDLEQYQRRPCVRIYGIPTVARETSDDVRNKVSKLITDAKLDIKLSKIDRAHRIGPAYS